MLGVWVLGFCPTNIWKYRNVLFSVYPIAWLIVPFWSFTLNYVCDFIYRYISLHQLEKGRGGMGCICMRVYIGVAGMKVWMIAKISIWLGGMGGICIGGYIFRVGLMNVSVTAKISLSESKREFLYYIFWVSSCGYTTFRVYGSVSIITSVYVVLWVRYRSSETNFQYGYRHKCI